MRNLRKKQDPDAQRSLFGEILDWMLAPLLFVWPISIAFTHYFANSVAGFPYDQSLREHVSAIARQIDFDRGYPQFALPGTAQLYLRSDEIDNVYFHLLDGDGVLVAGDPELPSPVAGSLLNSEHGEVHFRDDEFSGQTLRVAYMYLSAPGESSERRVLIEVGETTEKRSQLANKIIASVILPQFVIIPLAVVLVWFGLSQGLRPLTRLRNRIEARREADLSPISLGRVPEELRPLTEAFNSMLARMQHNVDAQRRFIANAAHQMRTPLTGLKTQAQLAMRESDPAEVRHALRQILSGVDRAAHLVDQLLALARAEASGLSPQTLQPLDLDQLLHEIVETWVMQALEKRIDLGYEPAGAVPILGNTFLLREMINNLLDNALRYTPAGGRVTARVVKQGDFALLEIEDNGSGIADDDSQKVFDRFYRAEGRDGEGSGLGLAIVREIAEVHQAAASLRPLTINASGEEQHGCIARIVFPLHRPPPRLALPEAVRSGYA
ncbi:sensor histidine kinase [Candidatus Accumulibacter sp. ACC003]|uniref:sensor histidine kinase n=1 Tax=Candidatus Accumulibacter sp. ACC003 TaxID=2823334 RepID=UPI0025B8F3E4|nr:sensor histidine kinase [Candidatus Accumulibacter sp. ACC003]